MSRAVSGTEGYAEDAEALVRQYESLSFTEVHRRFSHLFPAPPARVLDIGAGTGRDAAGFAALGHQVLAVEPTEALRTRAKALHPSDRIEWLDDSLPDLTEVMSRAEAFDLVMLTAVWMHLDESQRRHALPNVAALVTAGGGMMLSLRYGPVPAGRRMFAVPTEETIDLAAREGLRLVERVDAADGILKRPGVSWVRLAFRRPDG
jgi:SAM-dependent methyltransferase